MNYANNLRAQSLIFAVFLVIVTTVTLNNYYYDNKKDLLAEYEETLTFQCNSLLNCTRFGSAAIGYVVGITVIAVDWIFAPPIRNYGNPASNDADIGFRIYSNNFEHKQEMLRFVSTVLYRCIALLGLVYLFMRFTDRTANVIVLILASGFILSGFGFIQPFLAGPLFTALVSNQYHLFWEFQRIQTAEYFDFTASGFFALLVVAMVSGWHRNLKAVAALTFLGQLLFEHLGFITGVSLALYALLFDQGHRKSRIVAAAKTLFLAGIVSIAIAGFLFSILAIKHSGDVNWLGSAGTNFSTGDMFGGMLANLPNYKHILVRMSYFMIIPLLLGLIVGSGLWLSDARLRKSFHLAGEYVAASLCVLFAFSLAATIGFFTSTNYASEMPREFLPAALIAMALGVFMAIWTFRKFTCASDLVENR